MAKDIDNLDIRIIRELRRDSKNTYKSLSQTIGTSLGTIYNRIRKLEKMGIIKNYTINIDYSKLGYDLTALIMLEVDGPYIIEIEQKLSEYDEVMSVYDITGEFDVAVIAKIKDRDHLNKLIKTILTTPHIKRTVTSIALSIVKENFQK